MTFEKVNGWKLFSIADDGSLKYEYNPGCIDRIKGCPKHPDGYQRVLRVRHAEQVSDSEFYDAIKSKTPEALNAQDWYSEIDFAD
ncbi:hypothetical protein [Mastigocoleus testarum]|uniref:Uncharacterized protein n=1 Tax=Mastigocoleus testarum BC008 TaxID=371196 RepID=A0A0V7ZGM4_9CYAN|nr:hypothetical protein [Mastigocoleus testarum]KST63500.1 hypothetical protein BC008_13635 [Mastigocoleus testarum BC008]